MSDSINFLLLEFLQWVADRQRTYAEAMEAWQSHCPRQTIWEDALTDGLIQISRNGNTGDHEVTLTALGLARLHNSNGRD